MKPLTNVKVKRIDIIKNFFLVTILSTGVSLIANALTKDAELLISLIPGIICVLIVAIFYLKDYVGTSSYNIEVDAVLSIDNEKMFVPIERYGFSEDLHRAIVSVLSENKAYKSLWKDAFENKVNEGKKGKQFVSEFLEYLFINWISLKLNSYFAEIDNAPTELIVRDNIPDVLIKNRVIELISKPFEEREKFQEIIKQKDPVEGEIVYVNGEDGVLYDMLEIELPRKSKVYRKDNALVITNRNFDISFESEFTGFNISMPRYFEKFYMNSSIYKIHAYIASLKISIKLKPFFLFSINDWKYLRWIDQLTDEFVHYFSFDYFISRIGYESALTNHILFLNGLERKEEKEAENKFKDLRIIKVDNC